MSFPEIEEATELVSLIATVCASAIDSGFVKLKQVAEEESS